MSQENDDVTTPRLLTMKAAAAYLGVSTPTFAKWVDAGLFPRSVSITKMWDRKAIDAQLDKLSGLDTPAPEKEDSFAIWKRNRDARKAAGTR
jgi:predicted DNA-binding transcriptional regulator AlpA